MSKFTFCVIDGGWFLEQASALTDHGKNRVLYWTPWGASPFPKFTDYAIGLGFDQVEKAKYLDEAAKQADAFISFDCYMQDIMQLLKLAYPKKGFLCAGKGAILEDNRLGLKKIVKKLGLPMQKYEHVKGITNLKEYISKNPKSFIKTDIFRSEESGFSSFFAKNEDTEQEIFKEISKTFGPFDEKIDFCVEEAINTSVEAGFDGFVANGVPVSKCLQAYEYSKACYLGRVVEYKDLAVPLKETMDKFIPVFKILGYNGGFSTEEKILSPINHKLLDVCARLPSPCGLVYLLAKNFPEFIKNMALGKPAYLDIPHKYLGAVPLSSGHARKNWLRMLVKKEDREFIKFKAACAVDGKYFAVPGIEYTTVATLIAGGNTVDEVVEKLEELAGRIDAYGIDTDDVHGLIKIKEIIEKGKKVGIPF